jgi:hypothetical protein
LPYTISKPRKKKIPTFNDIQVEDYGIQFNIILHENVPPEYRYKKSEFFIEDYR